MKAFLAAAFSHLSVLTLMATATVAIEQLSHLARPVPNQVALA